MAMVELRLHDVAWCPQHGHPLLTMRLTGTDRYFAVSMAADDAASLASHPVGSAASRARLYGLVEAAIAGLEARLTEVQLLVAEDGILHATLRLAGPAGELALPAHFADGITLAHRRRVPLRMADEDVARVPLSVELPRPAALDGQGHLAPFRDVIEALDLDDFGPPIES